MPERDTVMANGAQFSESDVSTEKMTVNWVWKSHWISFVDGHMASGGYRTGRKDREKGQEIRTGFKAHSNC